MPEAWRIVKEKHAASAFSGEGAAKTGGRWNSRGVPVVYASATKALAALETLVHLNPLVPFKYVVFRLQFDEALIEKVPLNRLTADWRVEPPPPSVIALEPLALLITPFSCPETRFKAPGVEGPKAVSKELSLIA